MLKRQLAKLLLSVAIIFTILPVKADLILFAHVQSGGYTSTGNIIAGYLSDAGHTVTIRDLNTSVYDDYASFDQVWVYDLYGGAGNSDNQLSNYENIGAWYNSLDEDGQNLIADGRIISSPWNSESGWMQGYADSLDTRGGGLVLGTDHDYYVAGINSIAAEIGIDPFYGNVSATQAVVDQLSPLYDENGGAGTHICGSEKCVWDNSSPSYAPTGLQPNGSTLTPVAYHGLTSDAWDNAAISSTIGSITFGTSCGEPDQEPCSTVPEPGSILIFGLGIAGVVLSRRMKFKK